MKKVISIPNATRTFEALRSLGYDLNSSIADLIDNSITKKVNSKNVAIIFKLSNQKAKFRLVDDGTGMSKNELLEAMRLGSDSSYEDGDLGKFGMGMKTASLSHCSILTVISKKKNNKVTGYQWDLKHLKNSHDGWTLLELSEIEIDKFLKAERINLGTQGTAVFWDDMFVINEELKNYSNEKLRINFFHRIQERLTTHIGLVFHRFLNNKKFNITINKTPVKPWDPFCLSEKFTSKVNLGESQSKFYITGYKSPVKINAYILPNQAQFSSESAWKKAKGLLSWNDAQGYYIYRNDRVIRFGGWQGTKAKDEHDKLARISIDIHPELDHLFRLNVNKSLVQFPDQLFNHLKNVVNPITVKKAKQAYSKSELNKIFTNKFRKQTPLLASLSKSFLNANGVNTKNVKDSISVTNSNGTWIANKLTDFMKHGNTNGFEIVSGELKEHLLWKVVCHSDNRVKIILNQKHAFYQKFYNNANKISTNAIDALIYSLAIAELANRTTQNAPFFDSYKSIASETLTTIIQNSIV